MGRGGGFVGSGCNQAIGAEGVVEARFWSYLLR
jgi:hypothetical protein